MAKIIDHGPLPPDDPIYSSGCQVFTHPISWRASSITPAGTGADALPQPNAFSTPVVLDEDAAAVVKQAQEEIMMRLAEWDQQRSTTRSATDEGAAKPRC